MDDRRHVHATSVRGPTVRFRAAGARLAVAGLLAASWAGGCGRDSPAPGPASDERVHEAGADRKVRMAFDSGPIGELVITRDTARRLVIGGVCYFPDGTRLDVAIVDPRGNVVSRTQPVVEDAQFHSLPLATPDTSLGQRGYDIRLSASFAPGAQSPEVLRQLNPGERYVGEGMMMTKQGHFAYSRRLRVNL
jgi:hypothetical protein